MIELVKHPNQVLRQVAQPVTDIQKVRDIVDQAAELMYAGDGVGLAAPQIGMLERFVLVDPSAGEDASALRVMINPKVTWSSTETAVEVEGCLSLPGVHVPVVRPATINVSYTTLEGTEANVLMTGNEARIAQHEIDHLDGVTLLQRAKRKHRR